MSGNCKYGAKCALPHIDRHGNMVKPAGHAKGSGRHSMGRSGRGGRYNEHLPPFQQPASAPMGPHSSYHLQSQDDFYAHSMNQLQPENPFPMDDAYHLSSHLAAASPPTLTVHARSPQFRGSSALDVTLPASFSSQDTPFKFGPSAASVPSRFGWDPLTSRSPTTSTTKQQAQAQALGNLGSLASREPERHDPIKDMASSPPANNLGTLPRRIMHSDVRSRPQNISSSVPVHRQPGYPPSQLDEETLEEGVPGSLTDLLSDKEMSRRLSRGAEDNAASSRPSLSGFGSPSDSKVGSPKYGSPSHPSRYGALFARQHEHEGELRNSPSAFGHVGSPLRNSSLSTQYPDHGSSLAFGAVSPPDSTNRISGISSLSEQLRRTQIGNGSKFEVNENTAVGYPSGTRNISNGSTMSNGSSHGRYERTLSASRPAPERITEEDGLFSMEEDEANKERSLRKSSESARPKSYAGIAADNNNKTLAGLGVVGSGQPNGGNK
ncbi:MAG: hypothetical protein M1828_006958 [Chrysothrix sp. TS-e1954]|nr:MAG: hypothetical protein M1828_006958 [Chrysothrix sp. TS-e1954]